MPFLTTNHFFLFFVKSWLVVSEVNIYFPLTYQVVCRKEKLDLKHISFSALLLINKKKQQHENKVDKLTSLHLP